MDPDESLQTRQPMIGNDAYMTAVIQPKNRSIAIVEKAASTSFKSLKLRPIMFASNPGR